MALSPDQLRRALDTLAGAAFTDAQTLFTVADPASAVQQGMLFPIVQDYADAAAALGADYYDEVRDDAGVARPYRAAPFGNVDEERLRRAGLWAVDPLTTDGDITVARSRLETVVQPAVVNPFRTTITANQELDPDAVGYKRSASNGCKFCRMLAARGAVYRKNVHFASHPHCHCTATPVFANGDEGPEASVIQYTASQRRRTPAQQRAVREHLARMPDRLDQSQPILTAVDTADDARQATNQARRIARRERAAFDQSRLDDVADRFGVTVDELQAARGQVVAYRRRVYDEAAERSAEAFRILDGADALSIRRPDRDYTGGEFDWLERLDPREVERLRRRNRWLSTDTTNTVDEVAERLRETVPGLRNLTDDEVIRTVWLPQTRTIEASGQIRRGKLPSPRQYSNDVNVRDFAPILESEGFDVAALLADDLEAAGHIAQTLRRQYGDEAARILDAYRTDLGPDPWDMSFDAWEAEMRDLEYARDGILGNSTGLTDSQVRARLAHLFPPELDGPDMSYEDAYAAVTNIARIADYAPAGA